MLKLTVVFFVMLAASIPMVEERERVLTPMVRADGKLKAATWEDALYAAAELLNQKRKTYRQLLQHDYQWKH